VIIEGERIKAIGTVANIILQLHLLLYSNILRGCANHDRELTGFYSQSTWNELDVWVNKFGFDPI
jgi:hypothetical protein